MNSPIINSLSTTSGPANQWIYLFGENFVQNQTSVYFNNIQCEQVFVFSDTQLGFYLTSDAQGTGYFKVMTPEGQFTSDIQYTVVSPSLPPTVTNLRNHPNTNWVYVDGTEFVYGQTTVTYDGKTVNVFVYTPESGGFAKVSSDDVIITINLTTPNGSATYTVTN